MCTFAVVYEADDACAEEMYSFFRLLPKVRENFISIMPKFSSPLMVDLIVQRTCMGIFGSSWVMIPLLIRFCRSISLVP